VTGDLVDYLRDKLEHADDPVCTCGTPKLWTWDRQDHLITVHMSDCPVRDEPEHADDVVCTCPDCDISWSPDLKCTAKGWDERCPIHATDTSMYRLERHADGCLCPGLASGKAR